jgi:hypothetical protein
MACSRIRGSGVSVAFIAVLAAFSVPFPVSKSPAINPFDPVALERADAVLTRDARLKPFDEAGNTLRDMPVDAFEPVDSLDRREPVDRESRERSHAVALKGRRTIRGTLPALLSAQRDAGP